jgi:DNA integrity scanning protein DisA with diadenylate cyclase activity
MSKGFSDFDVEFDVKKEDIDRLLKKYKKLKKYQKSSLFALKTMDGTEEIISKLIQEAEDDPIT